MNNDYLMVIRDVLQHELGVPRRHTLRPGSWPGYMIACYDLILRHKSTNYDNLSLRIIIRPDHILTVCGDDSQHHAYEDPDLLDRLQQQIDLVASQNREFGTDQKVVLYAVVAVTIVTLVYTCIHLIL